VAAGGRIGIDRYGPQMAPCKDGGVWIAFVINKKVKIRRMGRMGQMGPMIDVGPGRCPTLCADPDGGLHVSYDNGGIKYRKITLK
jgi:hypothetical protein